LLGTDGILVNRVYDRPIRRVAVFGERSSGTNVCEYVLRRALGLKVTRELGWKHGFLQGAAVSRETLVVVSVRDPYAWVRSMYDKPWHSTDAMRNLGFSGFIRAPWDSVIDRPKKYFDLAPNEYTNVPLLQDRDPMTGRRFENLLQMRTAKLRHWTGLANDLCNLAVWQFEVFRENPDAIIAALSRSFGTASNRFDWPEWPLGVMQDNMRQGRIDAISPQDMGFINSQLDADLEQALGYSVQHSPG